MKSTPSKEDKKIELGKRTDEGYEYRAKIDLSQGLSAQISKVLQEREINEVLKANVEEIRQVVKKFRKKEKNLQYYYEIGRKLSFLDSDLFKKIAPYSIFRRIVEELPEVLPNVPEKVATKHLDIMYKLAHMGRDQLSKATWDQWYEIMKFKEVHRKQNLLQQALDACSSGAAGPSLRRKIQDIIGKAGGDIESEPIR
jgi:hypothetical protein